MSDNLVYYPNLFRTYYTAAFKKDLKQYHITQIDVDILLFLFNNPRYDTASEICRRRGLAKSNVSASLKMLEDRGYVETCSDPVNRRVKHLKLTEKSAPMMHVLAERQKACLQRVVEDFSEEERETARKLFIRMNQNMSRILETEEA